ncbi:hypothetical protein [Pseudoclavibacter sp. CFCC 13611]|uniref:hypothetical protein n=1 Tax=Pseudoclavibacter sp. CFCC 13611 TaxID=2615178 RepID=UPI0013014EF9|nr:hypothetical protein [Pseudoclavibacter sp. CFCC 13611]KAB1663243.1 hypothetical protein F8O08_05590 [Pseudoclavibacter sp. CFCC 13611]
MSFIWATRGYSWGFRFLSSGRYADPLPVYEGVFSSASADEEFFIRRSDIVGMRFLDPLGRKDRSGRVIPHEFVVDGQDAIGISTVGEGRETLWPRVSHHYEQVWKRNPSANDPGFTDFIG